MRLLRRVAVAVAVFAGVALGGDRGPAVAMADECARSAPDCEATMGLCGRYCTSCWEIDYENWQNVDEWCGWMCEDYGGGEAVISGNSGTEPDYLSVLCRCAWECPWYE
jgi:hypothetical protein